MVAGFASIPSSFLTARIYPDGEGLPSDGVWMCNQFSSTSPTDVHGASTLVHEFGHVSVADIYSVWAA